MGWFVRLSRSFGKCPPGWKLTRAVSRGLDADVGWHLSSCTRCSAEYRALRQTADALGALADRRMSEDTKDALGRRLVESALEPAAPIARRRAAAPYLLAMAALVVVVALAGVWVVRRTVGSGRVPEAATPANPRPWLGAVRAIGGARFARVRTKPDEIVRLDDGTVDFEVARLSGLERFRVITADAEIEVRGTSFEVSASHGKLIDVRVWRGRVEVRSEGGGGATVLDTGDEWVDGSRRLAPPARPEPVIGLAVAASELHPAVRLRPRPVRQSPVRVARADAAASRPGAGPSFNDAWSLLREGRAAQAAAAFDQVAGAADDGGVVEDARYWRAVALARAGEARAAEAALVQFLGQFPRSPRAGEASVILGWSRLRASDPEGARAAFTRGMTDPNERVRLGAREGLSRIGLPRNPPAMGSVQPSWTSPDANQGPSARSARTSESK
jgi:hypothetical protein